MNRGIIANNTEQTGIMLTDLRYIIKTGNDVSVTIIVTLESEASGIGTVGNRCPHVFGRHD